MFRRPLSDAMDLDLRDAVLGLDLGSSATRAVIRTLDENPQYFHVEDRDNTIYGDARPLDLADFSSTGYPFEDVPGPVYCPYAEPEVLHGRLPMSLKYGVYLLANASKKLLDEYPAVAHVCDRSDDDDFRARARRGLVELFVKVLDRVQFSCHRLGLRITRIALTVPVQWTLEFEEVYAGIMVDALRILRDTKPEAGSIFAVDETDIYFVTETEALAAYMFDGQLVVRPAEAQVENLKSAYFLFFDFGGHNMNGCGMFIKRSGTQTKSQLEEQMGFFTCFESFGKGGGSAHWEFLMGGRFSQMLSEIPDGSQPDKEAWTDMRDLIHKRKCRMGPPDNSKMIRFTVHCEKSAYVFRLQPGDINTDWAKAFDGILDVVGHKLEAFRRVVPTDADCTVVLAGGSAANAALQRRLTDLVELNSFPPPIFTSDFDRDYGSARIAKGAAFTIANLRTVQQFFDGGAAIGIQKRPGGFSKNKSNPSLAWETWSTIVLGKEASYEAIVDSNGTDEFKLICDPFFARFQRPTPDQKINLDGCYDLVYLGRRAAGQWRVIVSLEVVDGVDKLVIKTSHRKGTHAWSASVWSRYSSLHLPVHFVAGTNTVIVGERGKTLDETLEKFGLALPKNPDGSDGRGGSEADAEVDDEAGVPGEGEQEVADPEESDEYHPTDEEEVQEVVIARGTRSRPNRRMPQPAGRFTATPVPAAARKTRKRKATLAYLDSDVE